MVYTEEIIKTKEFFLKTKRLYRKGENVNNKTVGEWVDAESFFIHVESWTNLTTTRILILFLKF